jgi:hypothetical protein
MSNGKDKFRKIVEKSGEVYERAKVEAEKRENDRRNMIIVMQQFISQNVSSAFKRIAEWIDELGVGNLKTREYYETEVIKPSATIVVDRGDVPEIVYRIRVEAGPASECKVFYEAESSGRLYETKGLLWSGGMDLLLSEVGVDDVVEYFLAHYQKALEREAKRRP